MFLNVLALSRGGEGLGFGDDGSLTENPWSIGLRSFRFPSEQGGDPISQLEMDSTPVLDSQLVMQEGVPTKKIPKGTIIGGQRKNLRGRRWVGRGSTSSFSRTTLPDSRLGGVGRLALTVTQVSVGSQGQPAGRSPDRKTGQPTAAFTSAVLSPGNSGGPSQAVWGLRGASRPLLPSPTPASRPVPSQHSQPRH